MLLANKQMSKFDKDLLPGQSQNILYLNEFDVFFFCDAYVLSYVRVRINYSGLFAI